MGHELTPCFSPHPCVLDFVGKRQDVIVVIENLHGRRIVLGKGVTRESFDSVTDPHTLITILRKTVAKSGSHKNR